MSVVRETSPGHKRTLLEEDPSSSNTFISKISDSVQRVGGKFLLTGKSIL